MGIIIILAISIITAPFNFPYTMIATFLSYCMARKFGVVYGPLLSFLIDPIIFTIASIFPFFLARLICKDCMRKMLVDQMRVIMAMENSFDIHGIKIVTIFRMIPGNKMS